jgi:polysaccharide pyruvyl transferase CsaB
MFDLPGFLRKMRRCRLYINGGGSLIQDVTSSRSLWYYLYTLVAAKHRGCRVLMYGCGIGPVSRPLNRRLTGKIIDRYVDAITLREENSLEELRSFGVTRPAVDVASDPALTLPAASDAQVDAVMAELGLDADGKYICFCLRRWPGFEDRAECFARAADYAYEKYGLTPVFLSVNLRSDGAAGEDAAKFAKNPHRVLAAPVDAHLTIGLIARMQAVVAIRLHALIFAASQAVPVVGVSYDPKVASFLDYMGQENYLPLGELTEDGLCRLIDCALSADKQSIRDAAARLKDIEERNVRAAERLLRE